MHEVRVVRIAVYVFMRVFVCVYIEVRVVRLAVISCIHVRCIRIRCIPIRCNLEDQLPVLDVFTATPAPTPTTTSTPTPTQNVEPGGRTVQI